MRPYEGIKIIDITHVLAGPFAAYQMALLGADVIKVEHPTDYDQSRDTGGDRALNQQKMGTGFLTQASNKRAITLNLKHEKGREILKKLVKDADVVTENYRKGTLEKLGVGYDVLSAINPGIIYCAVSGYGRTGPNADMGGFDLIAQGFAGLMSVTGEPGRPPVKPGVPIADINAGLLAAMGVIAAYAHKLKTGEGQIVDTSLMEAALQQTYWHAAIYFATGRSSEPMGSAHVLTAPYQAFHAKDGWINIGGANQNNWERMCEALGHPEWKADPRFLTNDDRMKNLPALVDVMNAVLVTKTRAEWQEKLDAVGVPAGPVNSIGEAVTHPQVLARDMVVEVEHPQVGRYKTIGCPIHLSATPSSVAGPAPLLGEHTREILKQVGYSDGDIDEMVQSGTVAEPKEHAHA